MDGVSDEPEQLDVGVNGSQIAAIGELGSARAGTVIRADDKFVCPGFIDIQNHSDSYFTLLEIPSQDSLLAQGITTIVTGQCGTSLAPLPTPEALRSIQKWHSLAGANLNWLDFEEYFSVLSSYPLGVNVLSMAGHSTIRRGLIGDKVRQATSEEIKIMEKLLKESFAAGAAGLSLGLVYAHESNAGEAELVSAARIVAEEKKLLSVHLRSEDSHIIEALNEVITLAEKTKASLKISHFKIRGKKNWVTLDGALSVMDSAYQRGVDIFFDVYPYTTSWTVLYTYLPKWAYEGGRGAILKNVTDPGAREKIKAYLSSREEDLGSVFIATSETNPGLVGKTLSQIAANQEISVEEALLDVVSATNSQVVVFDHNLSEEVLETSIKHPLSVIATDGAGYDFAFNPEHGLVHPRCFGAMPKFLGMVKEKKLMTWPEAIKKITSRPADKLGLQKRGRIEKGAAADLVVFDPGLIGSTASYENPYRKPDGIDQVVVNGKLAYEPEKEIQKQVGEVLRL